MEKEKNLPNDLRGTKFPVELTYNAEQDDKYSFNLKLKAEKGKEYAVLFVNDDGGYYTAEIISGDAAKSFSVFKLKIAHCRMVKIVDIETEQPVFLADFKVSSLQDGAASDSSEDMAPAAAEVMQTDCNLEAASVIEMPPAPDNKDVSVEYETADSEQISDESMEESGDKPVIVIEDNRKSKVMGFISERQPQLEEEHGVPVSSAKENALPNEENEETKVSEQDLNFFADYEKDASEAAVLDEEEDDLYADVFIKEKTRPEVPKSQKASLLNDNESILEDIFERFDSFENPLKNHEFYALDEANAKKSSLKIILNGFIVPLLSPLLEYKNPFGSNSGLPRFLIGKTMISKETEYFVYGALGRNLREEQPFSGATGFVYFEKIKDSDEGYWLMYVNAKTGRISLPMKPKNIFQS